MAGLSRLGWALVWLVGGGCDPRSTDGEDEPSSAAGAPSAPDQSESTHAAIAKTSAAPPAGADDPSAAPVEDGLRLRPPPMRALSVPGTYQTTPVEPSTRIAQAFQFDAPVYHHPSASRRVMGLVRRSTRLSVDRWVPGDGCSKSWYALVGGGYVCTSDGFAVSSNPAELNERLQVEPPAVDQTLPYRYAKVKTPAPLYWRLPTEAELASEDEEPVKEQAKGAHFVAMDKTFTVGSTTLSRTVRGYYVRHDDLDEKPMPTMHGELLSGVDDLPMAFVHVDEATLLDPESGNPTGVAEKFARFSVARIDRGDGHPQVVATDGFAVDAEQVRVVWVRPRPEEVAPGARWIHVNLDQQTLVAYEGDTPVLATLVSSGKEGFEPPLGVFHVHKKYTTVTMSGPDPDAGTYAVEQVPWTMYYWASYALHGAYWHDTFGNVRSHGCTNIPPIDARWLFYWSEPGLPTGWHAKVGIKGPKVVFSREPVEAS